MAAARYRPTAEVTQTVASFVRAGGFPHVAAEAAGLPRDVFEDWLRRGRRKGAATAYRRFADAVRQAAAQARLSAEVAVLKNRPLDWLRSGPGRETPGVPGWTGSARAAAASGDGAALSRPEVRDLIALLVELLAPYPEARAALAGKLLGLSAE